MVDEYIRRQEMLDAVEELNIIPSIDGMGKPIPTEDFRVQFLGTVLKVEPADVVKVVRCKDCKYNATTHKYLNPDSFFLIPKDDDFCSYGERRGKQDG